MVFSHQNRLSHVAFLACFLGQVKQLSWWWWIQLWYQYRAPLHDAHLVYALIHRWICPVHMHRYFVYISNWYPFQGLLLSVFLIIHRSSIACNTAMWRMDGFLTTPLRLLWYPWCVCFVDRCVFGDQKRQNQFAKQQLLREVVTRSSSHIWSVILLHQVKEFSRWDLIGF